jgi:hypothetical protein
MGPRPADPFAWRAVLSQPDGWVAVECRLGRGALGVEEVPSIESFLICGDDWRLMDALEQRPEVRAWRVFARFPWAAIQVDERGLHVLLTDARYQMTAERDAFCALRFDVTREELEKAFGP